MALLNVNQVSSLLDIPQSTAYRIIKNLNTELKEQGFYIIRGKVEERYLKERFRLNEEPAEVV